MPANAALWLAALIASAGATPSSPPPPSPPPPPAHTLEQDPIYQRCIARPATCTTLDLPRSGLTGTISPQIGALTELRHLYAFRSPAHARAPHEPHYPSHRLTRRPAVRVRAPRRAATCNSTRSKARYPRRSARSSACARCTRSASRCGRAPCAAARPIPAHARPASRAPPVPRAAAEPTTTCSQERCRLSSARRGA